MSLAQEKVLTTSGMPELTSMAALDRRTDVEAKQALVAELLKEIGCDGLLVLQPENFAWLTAGATARGILDPVGAPALYFSVDGRWLLASNADTQRLFDEEIDGLGFQLKEWPWHWGRSSLLSDLCQGRNVASDTPLEGCTSVAERLARMRLHLSDYDRACYRALGQVLAHALEATGRTLAQGETEREVAGQLSHRLLHRGVYPLMIAVAADGRQRTYRQPSFTSAAIQRSCVLTVAARKYGLCACASRSICFGQPDTLFRREHDAACKVCATYVASSWPDSVPRQILASGLRIYQLIGAEHEFYLAPQGELTGRAPAELTLTPQYEDLFQVNWAVVWRVSVGAALSCDTFLISEDGPRAVTAAENWPLKRIRIQGAEFVRPDLLVR
jgi:Xaa-Pro dipeptidase